MGESGARWGNTQAAAFSGTPVEEEMLVGQYEYNIDQKGRVAIPARFREAFKEGLVLSQGFDRCIIVYPTEEWKRRAEKLAALPITRSNHRRINRATFSSAFSLELDRQGRVVLPLGLREYAQIGSEVVIAGIHSYLEIWSKDLWGAEKTLMSAQASEIAEAVEVQT